MVRHFAALILVSSFVILLYLGSFHSGSAQIAYRACAQENTIPCLSRFVSEALFDYGPTRAFGFVQQWQRDYPKFRPLCSQLVRSVGEEVAASVDEYNDIPLSPEVAWCDYRYFYGIFLEMEARGHSYDEAARFCDYAQTTLSVSVPDIRVGCMGSIGRMIGSTLLRDVDSSINQAIQDCDSISNNKRDRYSCIQGSLTELGRSGIGRTDTDESSLSVCKSFPESDKIACEKNVVKGDILSAYANDLRPLEQLYAEISDAYDTSAEAMPELVWVLAYGRGRQGIGENDMDLAKECLDLPANIRGSCAKGLALALAKHMPADDQYRSVASLCSELRDSGVTPEICISLALVYLHGIYEPAKFSIACAHIRSVTGVRCEDVVSTFSEHDSLE